MPVDQRVADLVGRLKFDEKAPLLTARESPLGSVERLGIPEYNWGANCIHGVQSRCGSRCPSTFPNPNAQGASWNRTSWSAMAAVTGVELRALYVENVGQQEDDGAPHLGLDCWSPNININRDPRWGRNLETPGEDPFLNGQYGAFHTRGLQDGDDERFLQAVVTLKHYDAYSLEDAGDSSATRHNFNAIVSDADLASTYFPAFKTAVEDGNAKGVMCSYNAVNGVPSCANKFLLQDVLRTAWNFTGYVTSDSGAVQDVYDQHHYLNVTAPRGEWAAAASRRPRRRDRRMAPIDPRRRGPDAAAAAPTRGPDAPPRPRRAAAASTRRRRGPDAAAAAPTRRRDPRSPRAGDAGRGRGVRGQGGLRRRLVAVVGALGHRVAAPPPSGKPCPSAVPLCPILQEDDARSPTLQTSSKKVVVPPRARSA